MGARPPALEVLAAHQACVHVHWAQRNAAALLEVEVQVLHSRQSFVSGLPTPFASSHCCAPIQHLLPLTPLDQQLRLILGSQYTPGGCPNRSLHVRVGMHVRHVQLYFCQMNLELPNLATDCIQVRTFCTALHAAPGPD